MFYLFFYFTFFPIDDYMMESMIRATDGQPITDSEQEMLTFLTGRLFSPTDVDILG